MRRRGGECNKGQEKGAERKRRRRRTRAQSGAVCPRPLNEIFIFGKVEAGDFCLLSFVQSLSRTQAPLLRTFLS